MEIEYRYWDIHYSHYTHNKNTPHLSPSGFVEFNQTWRHVLFIVNKK